MPPPSILPSLILCISLLSIVLPQNQSPPNGGYQAASNGGNQTPATANQTSPRRPAALLAREFLSEHNKVRINVTHPPFTWDRTLARHARRWGMKRAADCRMIHSYGPYGENLFWGLQDHWTPTEAVESWVSERVFYDAQNNACDFGETCGHYTQVIWRDSVKLGCTRVKCETGGILIICEYDPPGNFLNESPFGANNTAVAVAAATAAAAAAAGTSAANQNSSGAFTYKNDLANQRIT